MNDHRHDLEVRGVHVHYGEVCALEGISLHMHCGECVALLGRNGTGKSTLLKAIAGLVDSASGVVNWCGEPLGRRRFEVGYLPQREAVDWSFPLTVRGLVEMGRFPQVGWFSRFGKRDREAVDKALETMDLGDLQNRQIAELSGGQQQRAFIARALAQEAHIFLLDEPFAGLDQPSQENLAEVMRQLSATDHLVIASHHDLASASQIFTRAVVLNRTLVADGGVPEMVALMESSAQIV